MEDLKTIKEKEREEMHSYICKRYVEIKGNNPNAAPHRIFSAIATDINWTLHGVRKVLIKNNLYKGEEK